MKIPINVTDALHKYHATYRHPSLAALVPTGVYCLLADSLQITAEKCWPHPWPGGGAPGVYLVYDDSGSLLYVGKAANLSVRLSQHFKSAKDDPSRCSYDHENWRDAIPTYVIAVTLSKSFEAPALEGFLIEELRPTQNTVKN